MPAIRCWINQARRVLDGNAQIAARMLFPGGSFLQVR
jgi:hypothetical protein